jgi:uncharacterized protein Smg (DUF494 family)
MQEKIVEIIVFLINEMRHDKRLGDIDLRQLADRGYTENEISTAFSWMFDKINMGESILNGDRNGAQHSHRILHETERAVFTPEGHGYLIQLRELGLLDDMDLEMAIDRIMMAGFVKVGISEVNTVVASIMFDYDDSERIGSRLMLNSNDTIH